MADNIYSKGTRVWFTDKEQGWISAEVTNILRGSDERIKLTFVDDRGKVSPRVSFYHRRKPLTTPLEPSFQENIVDTTVRAIKEGQDDLPPLRNPPLLETADDLATLSHLNEPSGALCPSG
jgi:myosin V